MKKAHMLLVFIAVRTLAVPAIADVPQLLNYQGRLSDPSSNPQNGTFTMQFAVFDAETGGNQLPSGSPWSETQSVMVTNGVFNVLLGSVTPLPANLFEGGPSDTAGPLRFLQVVVNGEGLSPRRRIGSAAYAIQRTGSELGSFGGNGEDGALTITAGTTVIDLSGASTFVRNHTAISISGTGKLAFVNPNPYGTLIILKSLGDVSISCTVAPCIDASGMGALGGAGGYGPTNTEGVNGRPGNGAASVADDDVHTGYGGWGGNSTAGTYGAGGVGGGGYTNKALYSVSSDRMYRRSILVASGSGGGGGGGCAGSTAAAGRGGDGGSGGGALIIECGGTLSFTTLNGISVAGKDGVPGLFGGPPNVNCGGGGGGGGAGGMCVLLYRHVITATGTINNAGGNGGAGGGSGNQTFGAFYAGGGGGGAGSYGGSGGAGAKLVGGGAGIAGSPAGGNHAAGGGGSGAVGLNQPGGAGGAGGASSSFLVTEHLGF